MDPLQRLFMAMVAFLLFCALCTLTYDVGARPCFRSEAAPACCVSACAVKSTRDAESVLRACWPALQCPGSAPSLASCRCGEKR